MHGNNAVFGPELAIVGVEQTQAIQYFSINGQGSGYAPDNSVPLIARRALVLRVYVNDRRDRPGLPVVLHQQYRLPVTGQIVVHRINTSGPDTHVATLEPSNAIRPRPAADIDRGDLNHTLNFRLDRFECFGNLRFTVTVREVKDVFTRPMVSATQPSTAPNSPISTPIAFEIPENIIELPDDQVVAPGGPSSTIVVYGRFESVPVVRVRVVRIHYTGDGMDLPAPSMTESWATFDWVRRTFPIGVLILSYMEIEYDGDLSNAGGGGGCGPGWTGLTNLLQGMAAASDDNDIYVALVPSGANSPENVGCGSPGVAAAFAAPLSPAFEAVSILFAEEFGHALGRHHSHSGKFGTPGADPAYPTYNTYPPGSIGEFGFDTTGVFGLDSSGETVIDISSADVYNPMSTFDFMNYPGPNWISPYTYMGLRDGIVERFSEGSMARAKNGARSERLHLNFRVNRDDSVEMLPSFHLPSTSQPTPCHSLSEISCELLNKTGDVLQFHRCRQTGNPQDQCGPYVVFQESIPWKEQAVAIRFLKNREVLQTHDIEKEAPKVKIRSSKIQNSEGTMSLEWTGNHKENELAYMVRYSNDDGATWRVVAANLRGTSCELKAGLLPGGEQCSFQVVGMSGIRTSVTQTESFSSPLKPGVAVIHSPAPETEVPNAASLVLRGEVFSPDSERGEIEDVVWSSNLHGLLGRGDELVVKNLPRGPHTITMAAPDGLRGIATASVVVRIL